MGRRRSERERDEYIRRASTERSALERHYGLGRHPAGLRYGRRGSRPDARRELLKATVFLATVVVIFGGILVAAAFRS